MKEEGLLDYPYGEAFRKIGTDKYTGKELDDSTGLYFYEARYYDAVLGRFISADTIVPDPQSPQDFNRYSYANNNPVIYNDPSGHCPVCIGIAIGVVVGGVSAGIQSGWDLQATLTGAAIGGIAGGVGAGVGSAVSTTVGSQFGPLTGFAAGGLVGGAATGGTSAVLYRAAGYNTNIGLAIATGAAGGIIAGGFYGIGMEYGSWGRLAGSIASAPASGAGSAAINGGEPGVGALLGLRDFGMRMGVSLLVISFQHPISGDLESSNLKDGRKSFKYRWSGDYPEGLQEKSWYAHKNGYTTVRLEPGHIPLKNGLEVQVHLSETNSGSLFWKGLHSAGLRHFPEHTFLQSVFVTNAGITFDIPYGSWNYAKIFIVPHNFDAGRGSNPIAEHRGGATLMISR